MILQAAERTWNIRFDLEGGTDMKENAWLSYSEEQKAELRKAMDARIPKSVILSFFYPKTSPGDMAKIREQYLSEH